MFEMGDFSVVFNRSGEWEVTLPPDVDLADLTALLPIVAAIKAFVRRKVIA